MLYEINCLACNKQLSYLMVQYLRRVDYRLPNTDIDGPSLKKLNILGRKNSKSNWNKIWMEIKKYFKLEQVVVPSKYSVRLATTLRDLCNENKHIQHAVKSHPRLIATLAFNLIKLLPESINFRSIVYLYPYVVWERFALKAAREFGATRSGIEWIGVSIFFKNLFKLNLHIFLQTHTHSIGFH